MRSSIALAERHSAVSVELLALEAASGAALLDGKKFDASSIIAKRGELKVLEAAITEDRRRDRAASMAARRAQRAAARVAISESLAAHKKDLLACRKAAKQLAATLRSAILSADTLRAQATSIRASVPGAIDPFGLKVALSRLIAGELVDIGGRCHFGDLKWPSVPPPDWEGHISKALEPAFDAIISEGSDNDIDDD